MSNTLTVRSLDIKYTAGFPGGLPPMTFGAGVNIIFGANASGKTTTARAIQALFWPQSDSLDTFLIAELTLDDQPMHCRIRGGVRDDDEALPHFGDATCRHRYMLAQHELLTATDKETRFADQMLTAARGGLDLVKAIGQLNYVPFKGGSTPRELIDAQRACLVAKNNERDIQRVEAELVGLAQTLEEAKEARQRLDRLVLALEYLAKCADEQRLADELAQFPPVFEQLTGQELKELDGYTAEIEQAITKCTDEDRVLATAAEVIRQTGLADIPAVEKAAAVAAVRCATIEDLERKIDTIQGEQRRAESEAKSAYANLGGQDVAKYADPLSPTVVDELGQFTQTAAGLAAQRQALEAQRIWLESVTPPPEAQHPDTLRDALKYLQQWLVMPSPAVEAPSRLPIAGITALALAVLTGLLAVLGHGSIFGVLAVLFSVTALILVLQLVRRPQTPVLTRAELQQRFTALNLPGFTDWSEPAVERFILDLQGRLAAVRLAEATQHKRNELAPQETALAEQMQALEPERQHIAGALGIDQVRVVGSDSALWFFINQLVAWQQKCALARAAEAELAGLTGELQQQLAQATLALATFGFSSVGGNRELQDQLKQLEKRKNAYQQAEEACKAAQGRRQENTERQVIFIGKRDAMLARLALDTDPDEARRQLSHWFEQLDAYQTTVKAKNSVTAVRLEIERKSVQYIDWNTLVAAGESNLRVKLEATSEKAERIAEISNTLGDYQRQVRTAKERVAGEEAEAVLDHLTGKLRQRLEEALHAAVGHYVAMQLDAEVLEAGLPEVFQRARQFFAEFTNGRYDLHLDQALRDFRAYDRTEAVERTLDHLSSATRVQLLMAVRMAFVEQHEREQRVTLPMLMDETLASSDEQRERAIITTALQISQTGRQVFYFTSKPAELAKWRQLAAQAEVALQVVSLDETPPSQIIDAFPALSSVIPDSAGMSHEAYGQATQVSRLDFRTGRAAGAHVWYVVDDDDRLKALLEAGIATCGQLGNPHLTAVVDHLLGPLLADKARARVELLMALERLWWEGRGKPLHFQALQESGVMTTDTFRKEIPALAEQHDWDTGELIAALVGKQVKGFRTESIQRLRDFCVERGYQVDGEPLTPDELREWLLSAATEMIVAQRITPAEVQQLFDLVFPCAIPLL